MDDEDDDGYTVSVDTAIEELRADGHRIRDIKEAMAELIEQGLTVEDGPLRFTYQELDVLSDVLLNRD